jgi:hypothetical protein
VAVLLVALVIAVIVALTFTLGAVWIVALPVLFLVVAAVWGAMVLSKRSPGSVVRRAPKPELLGPGGPDDPDAR